nr:NADH-dependent [FeFe] hydrogenase, group A6 [Clostridioides sp.]
MNLVNLTINGKPVSVPEGTSILDAAKTIDIKIHNLCYLKADEIRRLETCASCRVCMVETDRGLVPSCGTLVKEGMKVETNSLRALKTRKKIVELILSDHPQDCLVCEKNGECRLQEIAADLGIRQISFKGAKSIDKMDTSSKSIVKDHSKCILCRKCEAVCNKIQTVGAISGINRGFNTVVGTFFDADIVDTECTYCGQCVAVCPTGSLKEVNNITQVWRELKNADKIVVVQVAPAVRVALGEEFGLKSGEMATGKIVAALKALGFKYVFDTNFGADLTIMEEASELIHRIKENKNLPILTSCCSAWVNFIEYNYPEKLDLISSCKSPQQMFGSITKSYYAEKLDIDPKNLCVVSVMPCVAKKYETNREELEVDDIRDNDISITTRELSHMIKESGIDILNLLDEDFDSPLGESTGAGTIFGASGGVTEAALRTSYEWITGKTLDSVDFREVRGFRGIKEASVHVGGSEIKVCVVNSLGNARKIMDDIVEGKSDYHIVEVMACPGGCIGGGGQPFHFGDYNIVKSRGKSLYKIDENKEIRKSHDNPYIKKLYDDFLGKPNSETSHKYLHTTYKDKSTIY